MFKCGDLQRLRPWYWNHLRLSAAIPQRYARIDCDFSDYGWACICCRFLLEWACRMRPGMCLLVCSSVVRLAVSRSLRAQL